MRTHAMLAAQVFGAIAASDLSPVCAVHVQPHPTSTTYIHILKSLMLTLPPYLMPMGGCCDHQLCMCLGALKYKVLVQCAVDC
jgi:hypothetical protein